MARVLFDPASKEPFAISRSKIELFLECPRCFYLDRRLGIGRPDGPPFTLNLAVDALMKKEFDFYRLREEAHPCMNIYGVDAVPFRHADLSEWRDTPRGIRSVHGETNLEVFGLIDDVWVQPNGELCMVDYKATSTAAQITLDERYGYKRQIEVYQWLFRRNGFTVSPTGYFVFVNATRDRNMFDNALEFIMQILPHEGSCDWIEDALRGIRECLESDVVPPSVNDCEWCEYRKKANGIEN